MKQNQLIRMIPNLPAKARTGNGRTQLGWKQLNTNNISRDLSNPLTVNKQEVHISEIQVTQDDEELFDNIEAMCKAHEQEAAALTRSRPTYATLMDFVERTSQANRAGRISSMRLQRGTHDFRLPFC
jgi:cobyrinic acid a,c-diamide synthase